MKSSARECTGVHASHARMDEMWMKSVGGSTGSTSGTSVAYATCAESLTPSARATLRMVSNRGLAPGARAL